MPSEMNTFHQGVYEQSFQEIRTLKKRLPEDAIISLAREVLLRVAERATDVRSTELKPMNGQIERLARALISDDSNAGADMIRNVHSDGASLEDVYLLHLAEAARKLGDWWNSDQISLVDVTVGTGRIYAIMRGLSRLFPLPPPNGKKAAMFTVVPGETHTIGVKMAADLFRKKGWDIDLKIDATTESLREEIRDHHPRIVGLSAGGEHATEALAKLIIAIRINSPSTTILVSGQIVNEATEIVRLMGPDALVFDFSDVESEMDRLWELTEVTQAQA